MNDQEKDRERRRQLRLEHLGTSAPKCPLCGESDWRCFESHHIAGRKFDDIEIPVCRNCHAKASNQQRDHPGQISNPPHPLERIAHFLLGLADLLVLVASKLHEVAQHLIEEIRKPPRARAAARGRRRP